MRLLVVGFPLPNVAIDNYNVLTAPSYFDYDALFIDPESITRVVRQVLEDGTPYEAFDGRQVLNAPTTASGVSIADQLRRRAEETQRLLQAGGTVIVVARPNIALPGVLGFEGCDRYSWLPAPPGMSWNPPHLRAAEGKTVRITAEDHPLAPLFRQFRSNVFYRATFDDRHPAFRESGRILAEGGAGVPIAVEFPVLGGRVVFIPAIADDTGNVRSDIGQAVVDAASQLLGAGSTETEPAWVRSVGVPGLEQVEAELEDAETSQMEAHARLESVRERAAELGAHRRLLWVDGQGFREAVRSALGRLGFNDDTGPDGAIALSAGEERALVEVESGREQVVEWPYVRLQRRLEERLLKQAEQLKGIVVVNGHRLSPPDGRAQEYSDALRIACENYRYCLLTANTLFALAQRALAGADYTVLDGIRRRILRTNGLLESSLALGEVPEDSGTIF